MKLLHALSCATFPSTKTNQRKEKIKNRHIQKQLNHVNQTQSNTINHQTFQIKLIKLTIN